MLRHIFAFFFLIAASCSGFGQAALIYNNGVQGQLGTTNSKIAGGVMQTDGTNVFWGAGSAITNFSGANILNGTLTTNKFTATALSQLTGSVSTGSIYSIIGSYQTTNVTTNISVSGKVLKTIQINGVDSFYLQ